MGQAGSPVQSAETRLSELDTYRSSKALDIGRMIVLDCVRIEQLASVVGIIPCLLQPHGQEVLIQTLAHELRVASIWRAHICDIGIMGSLPRPQRDPRRTAQGNGTKMTLVEGPLVEEVLLQIREIVERLQMQIL